MLASDAIRCMTRGLAAGPYDEEQNTETLLPIISAESVTFGFFAPEPTTSDMTINNVSLPKTLFGYTGTEALFEEMVPTISVVSANFGV